MRNAKNNLLAAIATILAAAAVLSLIASPARAEIYRLDVTIFEAGSTGPGREVTVDMAGLDPTKSTNLRVRRPGMDTPVGVVDFPAGQPDLYTDELTELRPGDSIEVRQPLNGVDPVETLTLPTGAIEFDGSRVSGTVGTGTAQWLEGYATCVERRERRLIKGPGRFSFDLGAAATAGRDYVLAVRGKPGFLMRYTKRAPGERPCVTLNAVTGPNRPPGSVVPEARNIYVNDLDPTLPTTRLVVRRGTESIVDRNLNSPGYLSFETDVKVLPGDRIELYRPQTAPAPSTTIEVPQVRAIFDPVSDLAVVRGPSLGEVGMEACRPDACEPSSRRPLTYSSDLARFDFGERQGAFPRFDLEARDRVRADVKFARVPLRYALDAVPGDLTPPSIRIRTRDRVRYGGLQRLLGKGLPVRVTSSEPALGEIRLAIGGKILARAGMNVGNRPVSARVRFTPSGKRIVQRWLARSVRKSRTLRVESRLTDRSGNPASVARALRVIP